jgi:sugar phosphate permease
LAGALTVASFGHRLPRRLLVFGGLGLFSVMMLLLAMTSNFYLALVWLALAGWGMLLYFSTTNTLIQTSVPDEMRGRVMGVWAMIFGGMLPVGNLEAGALSHWLDVPWTVAIGALVCGAAALVTWLRVRQTPPAEAGEGKPEIRNPKSETNSKPETRNPKQS